MPNVDETNMREYLKVFHETYVATVDQFLDADERGRLERYSMLPAKIIGLVSTQHGAGFEYEPADEMAYAGRRASRGIEDILVDGPLRLARHPVGLGLEDSKRAKVIKAGFDGLMPFRLEGDSDVTLVDTEISLGGWRRTIRYAEVYTDRSAEFWSATAAVTRAKDEVLVALTDLRQMREAGLDLRSYLRGPKEKTVLVLGDFGTRRDRLDQIKATLRRMGYQAITLDDVDDSMDQDLAQKFIAISHVARFLVFDNSSASGHLSELQLAQNSRLLRIMLHEEGTHRSYMSVGQAADSTVVHERAYTIDTLSDALAVATDWAEQRFAALSQERNATFPWRQPDE